MDALHVADGSKVADIGGVAGSRLSGATSRP
jgi:hypothetical protein